ncbi:MAG: methylmalonyl-CoA epimerase [candidate division Zixibacteria bacterium]|nr:methylmalonyl-CoA epimerase [candidate division Zixibacteria bacterium]
MKVLNIDHIGIAVKQISDSMEFYSSALGLKLGGTEEVPERHLKVGFIEIGSTRIELIESTSDESAIAKYIEKKGGGLHHICLSVDNIVEALTHMKNKGFKLIDNEPKDGAEGSKVAFVHPKSAGGVLIELKELPQ